MLIDRLQPIFQDIFDSPDLRVAPETSPEDIPDWDSVSQVKLVLAVEEAFAVELSMDEIVSLKTVGDFERVLAARGISG
jgi:acyl carrier protein